MHKYIVTLCPRDESKAFGGVKPLHLAGLTRPTYPARQWRQCHHHHQDGRQEDHADHRQPERKRTGHQRILRNPDAIQQGKTHHKNAQGKMNRLALFQIAGTPDKQGTHGQISQPQSTHQITTILIIFIITALLWITKDLINKYQTQVKLDDTMIAVFGAILLFIIPSKSLVPETKQILEWQDTQKMAWGILLLFGGGISLANQLEKAGLIQQLGTWIAGYAGTNLFLLIFLVTIISIFISEIMSNVAQVIVFAPVVAGIADALHISPLLLGIPMTLGASCAGMLPMGTPPNAIVFASGRLKLSDMVKTGFVMNLISTVLITLFSYYLLPMIVPTIK